MFENITITIKDILQSYSFPDVIPHDGPWKSLTVDQIIENGKDKFFDFTFPWYADDKTGLDEFKNLFLRKNYMKQIGQETTAQFKLYVQARLMEKMPLYKQLYESSLIEYNPLVNRKITTTKNETENREQGKESENIVTTNANGETTENNTSGREATGEGTQKRTNEQEGTQERTNEQNGTQVRTNNQEGVLHSEINSQSIHSENPEITMANKDYASAMDREKKTEDQNTTQKINENTTDNQSVSENTTNSQSVSENTTNNQSVSENTTENNQSSSEASSTENGKSTENEKEERNLQGNEIIEGFYGDSQAEAILKYRETILNINEMICNDMNDLFLSYYGGNTYGLCW